MSKLILIRHAKSDWSGNVNDLQRGLNKRGHNPILNSLMYQLSTKGYNKLPVNLVTCGVVIIEYSENNFKPPVFTNGEVIDYFFS